MVSMSKLLLLLNTFVYAVRIVFLVMLKFFENISFWTPYFEIYLYSQSSATYRKFIDWYDYDCPFISQINFLDPRTQKIQKMNCIL